MSRSVDFAIRSGRILVMILLVVQVCYLLAVGGDISIMLTLVLGYHIGTSTQQVVFKLTNK